MMIKAKRRFQNTSSTASLRLPLTKRFLTHGQEWKAEPVHATRHSSRLGAKQLALIGLRKHFWPAPHLGSKTFCSPSAKWFYAWAGFQWCADLDYLSFDPGITWLWWGGHLEAASWICDIVGAPKERQGCCAQALWHQSFWISQKSWKIQVLSKWNAGCLWIFGVLCGIMLPSPWTMHFSLSMFLGLVQSVELLCGNSFIAKALPQTLASIGWTSIGFYHQCRLVTGVQTKDALGSAFLWCFEAPWSTSWGLVFGKETQGHQETCKFTLQHISLWKFFACFSDCWAHPFIGNIYGIFQRWVFLGKCQKANQEDDERSSKQWLAICW